MNKITTGVSALVLTALMLTNCQPEEVTPGTEEVSVTEVGASGESRVELAKLFAQAMEDPSVLSFLHAEADKQFNRDYDVLIGLVKDQLLPGSEQTLIERLGELAGSQEEVEQLLAAEPLFTLFRPDTEANADRQATPLVALKVGDNLVAYDPEGSSKVIEGQKAPKVAAWAAKTNERAVLSGSSNARLMDKPGRALGVAADGQTMYLPASYDPELQNTARWMRGNEVAQDVINVFNSQKGCDSCVPRDGIYWGMNPATPWSEAFSYAHVEAIPWIKMANPATYTKIFEDWTEGQIELHFRFFYPEDRATASTAQGGVAPVATLPPGVPPGAPGAGAFTDLPPVAEAVVEQKSNVEINLAQDLKTITVSPNDLYEFDGNGNAVACKTYEPEALFLVGWNDLQIGNRIQVYIEEYDPEQGFETINTTVTSTFNSNFGFSLDIGESGGGGATPSDGATPPINPVPGGPPVPPVPTGKTFLPSEKIGDAIAEAVKKNGKKKLPLPTKVGFGLGFRYDQSRSKTTTTTTSLQRAVGSDVLGTVEFDYHEPVVSWDYNADGVLYYWYFAKSSGDVIFPLVPKRIRE